MNIYLKKIVRIVFGCVGALVIGVSLSSAAHPTLLGIDVLVKEKFKSLHGSRVALITNHTGLDRTTRRTVDLLHSNKHVNLVCIMTPEHGFRGVAADGQKVADHIDQKTGVPVYSLYGTTVRPTPEMLKGVDTLIFDIQDIGTRFYTYISTMGQALEEAAKHDLKFVVLDRPNPIRGDIVEGDILDDDIRRMTGYFSIPVRHGLTVGELALWFNSRENLGVQLNVVAMQGWSRHQWFEDTGLVFTPPSPNIRSLTSALIYPGIGCFEATNISVGRGTNSPFETFGAPWINARALCAFLRSQNFPGALFEIETFIPKTDIYESQECFGVKIIVTDRALIRPFEIFVRAFEFLHNSYPREFKPNWDEVRVVTGSRRLQDAIQGKLTFEELLTEYRLHQEIFLRDVASFTLY